MSVADPVDVDEAYRITTGDCGNILPADEHAQALETAGGPGGRSRGVPADVGLVQGLQRRPRPR